MRPIPITLDSHSCRVIAGMLKSYVTIIGDSPVAGGALVEQLKCDEIEQAMDMRKMLFDACANELRRQEA